MEVLLITTNNGDGFHLLTHKEHYYRVQDSRLGTNLECPWELYDEIYAIKDQLRQVRIFGRAGYGAIYLGSVDSAMLKKLRAANCQNNAPYAKMAEEQPRKILEEWLDRKPNIIERFCSDN